ncbi:MAG TPA: radical SAM protein [candidate division WOR-3 bacterium]|uniref:Radical SAM protein n=1 Tax=candidate division WOR-3 bacterium TaxID=2052148 RepID=A0A7C5DFB4_UNCW3|nr:radical SAM protein [candidate division WOR-3 bacterium]
MGIASKGKKLIAKVGIELMKINFVMENFLKWGEKEILKQLVIKNERNRPIGAQEEKYYIVRNLMKSFEKKLKENYLAPSVRDWVFNTLVRDVILNWAERYPEAARRRKAEEALPTFITLSPTQKCNLACVGCYAASSNKTFVTLDWDTVDRIMYEKRKYWGSHFTVISGGEPLLYESQGKTIFDLFEKYHDTFFLMYTNGTLIDKDVANKLAELGNVAPAISVEGFEEKTDTRRGKGVFQKILDAMDNLSDAGVIYGISLTATRNNVEEIVSDKFIDFFFEERDAAFAWMFQYMPIGRGPSFDLMITPEQRRQLWFQERHLIKDKGIFFVDFWNGGPISDGCISAGRKGGYLYIDWHGNVMPCVFVPYSVGNIKTDFFDKGKTIDDVLQTPLFMELRKWQENYSYKKPAPEAGNEIVPCPIRDHHLDFHKIVEKTKATPVGITTERAFRDEVYIKDLAEMGRKAAEATNDIWEKEYKKIDAQ